MMDAQTRVAFGRLGQVCDVSRNSFGSREDVVLSILADPADTNSIVATMALAKRGPSMLQAKRAIEAVLDTGETAMELHNVESRESLVSDLAVAGFHASFST